MLVVPEDVVQFVEGEAADVEEGHFDAVGAAGADSELVACVV